MLDAEAEIRGSYIPSCLACRNSRLWRPGCQPLYRGVAVGKFNADKRIRHRALKSLDRDILAGQRRDGPDLPCLNHCIVSYLRERPAS